MDECVKRDECADYATDPNNCQACAQGGPFGKLHRVGEMNKYATVSWTARDVQTLRPEWSLERCEDELIQIEKDIADAMTEHGWGIMEFMLISRKS